MSVLYLRSLIFRSTVIREQIERERRESSPNPMRLLKLHALRASIRQRIDVILHDRRRAMTERQMRRYRRTRAARAHQVTL